MPTTFVGHVVVCFRRLQILENGKERSVIAAYHVTDGIDSCCVGFHKRVLTKFSSLYEGMIAQESSVQSGYSVAVIISCLPEETIRQMTIKRVDDTESDESKGKIFYFKITFQVKHETMKLLVFNSILSN